MYVDTPSFKASIGHVSVSFIICMLILLLKPFAGLYFCVGLDFVTLMY
jgi:hypothetical protein